MLTSALRLRGISFRFVPALAALIAFLGVVPAPAATPGQSDTFTDLTTANWTQGQTPALTVNSGGGPGGGGDAFLQMTADGAGPQGRLTMFNDSQWTGSYSGIAALSADLISFDSQGHTLNIRFALDTAPGNSAGYVTTPFALTNDGQWHHVTFLLDAGHLTAVNGPPSLATVLANVGELRLVNAASPSILGDPVVSSIGIDNITAVPVPEPAALALLAPAALALLRRRR